MASSNAIGTDRVITENDRSEKLASEHREAIEDGDESVPHLHATLVLIAFAMVLIYIGKLVNLVETGAYSALVSTTSQLSLVSIPR